jgi:hypothetical protein
MSETLRDSNGHFAAGTAPGPGRPRRAIEIDYARTLADAVSLADWRKVCDKALADAKEGDSRAREWLSNRLLGDGAVDLMGLAVREMANLVTDEEVTAAAELQAETVTGWAASVNTPFDHAIVRRVRLAEERKEREREAAEVAERELQRIKRAKAKKQADAGNTAGTGQ